MAIRYSGEVTVRMKFQHGRLRATVRAPGFRTPVVSLPLGVYKIDSEGYDHLALAILTIAVRQKPRLPIERRGRTILIRRVFIAPCPPRYKNPSSSWT